MWIKKALLFGVISLAVALTCTSVSAGDFGEKETHGAWVAPAGQGN